MKYKYHIITPFSRFQNLCQMRDHLEPFGITWHLVCEKKDVPFRLKLPDWMKIVVCDPIPPAWFAASWKPNWFIEHQDIDPEARYILLNDDDYYEEGFFEKVDAVDGDLLVCSMKRGNRCPDNSPNPQLAHTLWAQQDHLACGGIGGEQVIMSGVALKQARWAHPYAGDWNMIANIIQKYPPVFVPDAFVWFNYLEPERWDK